MAKKIIISFDYELFFGDEPGTVQKSLLEPTAMLMDAMEYAGAKATFFVDYLMLKYMLAENEVTKSEANLIIEQLKEMVRRGHRIELHLHPHWVDAKYINGKWDFSDFSHYCLNSFPKEEITKMFVEGTKFLESIAREVESDYKIIAFRAGGWAILPFELMKEGFEKAGIKVDSSIMKGSVIHAYGYDLDFTSTPEKGIYKFSDNVLVEDVEGGFIEAQISSFKFNVITSYLRDFYTKFHPNFFVRLADGTHNRKKDHRKLAERTTKWQRLNKSQVFGLAGLPPFLLNREIHISKQEYVVIISHPKDIMPITLLNIRSMKGKGMFSLYNELM